MKKLITVILSVVMIFAATSALAADISVVVNGEAIEFDRQPVLDGETVMIPYRFVAEKLGATVRWFEDTQTIFTNYDGVISTIQINNDKLFLDAETVELDKAPVINIDRTMVTATVLEKGIGAKVVWDAATSTVKIDK